MAAVKQTCKNHTSYTYSGREMSPLGLGYSAEAEEVGTVMEGRDKTMWMVGIKNAVRVWNRIPTQVAATVVPPLAKEVPSMTTDEIVPEPVAPPPKKKAAPKKKVVAEEPKPAPEPAPEPEIVPEPVSAPPKKKAAPKKKVVAEEPKPAPEPEPEIVPEPVAAPPKKKAAPRKKEVEAEPKAEVAEKKEKKPTAFNIYMGFRMNQLKTSDPSMDNKQRFVKATSDWKAMSDTEKAAALADAKEWHNNKA